MSDQKLEVATTTPVELSVATPTASTMPPEDIQVTAENADEMAVAQNSLIAWCKQKIASMRAEWKELKEAYEHAKERKWKSDTLKRHSDIACKRVDFYERMLTALEHGYQIVPNFPVTAFAIRTDRTKPLKMATTYKHTELEQPPAELPQGEGEYKNPFPVIYERLLEPATQTKSAVKEYFAEAWRDLEFPFSMAKLKIMEATDRAMALKIFDDFGILPSTRKADPLIVARLKVPSWNKYDKRYVSFIIAWHLDTSTI